MNPYMLVPRSVVRLQDQYFGPTAGGNDGNDFVNPRLRSAEATWAQDDRNTQAQAVALSFLGRPPPRRLKPATPQEYTLGGGGNRALVPKGPTMRDVEKMQHQDLDYAGDPANPRADLLAEYFQGGKFKGEGAGQTVGVPMYKRRRGVNRGSNTQRDLYTLTSQPLGTAYNYAADQYQEGVDKFSRPGQGHARRMKRI